MTENPSAPERVQALYRKLSTVAIGLNSVSDELGSTIIELEEALKKLNLGISAWVAISGSHDDDGSYWSRDIGYGKVGKDWAIALRDVNGNDHWPEDEIEIWRFNEAPRWMRVEGVDKIPELLEQLIKQATETGERIKLKTAKAKEFATAVKAAAAESNPTVPLASLARAVELGTSAKAFTGVVPVGPAPKARK